jgi:hypothetical protein
MRSAESSYELNFDRLRLERSAERLSCRADSELVELHASRQRNALAYLATEAIAHIESLFPRSWADSPLCDR